MMRLLFLLVLLGSLAGGGCATPIGQYFADRALDFGDCFIAEAGVGIGVDVHILCTDMISTGAGISYVNVVGVRHGKKCTGRNVHIGLPFSPFVALLFYKQGDYSFPPLWVTDAIITGSQPKGMPNPTYPRYETSSVLFVNIPGVLGREDWDWRRNYPNEELAAFDIEVGVTAGLFSLRVGFSIGQFVDFLLGWFGVDIGGDDGRYRRVGRRPKPTGERIYPTPTEKRPP